MSCTSAITVLVLFITYAIQALLMKLSLREVATNSPMTPPLGLYVEPSVVGGPGVCVIEQDDVRCRNRCFLLLLMSVDTVLWVNEVVLVFDSQVVRQVAAMVHRHRPLGWTWNHQ